MGVFALVDAIPLNAHFKSLPGDDQVEPARISLKRRMRRIGKGTESGAIVEHAGPLPEKSWKGLPRYELALLLQRPEDAEGNGWPRDEELGAIPLEEATQTLTSAMTSFRSPAHKKVHQRREFHYRRYLQEFKAEVQLRGGELAAVDDKEKDNQRTWQFMVKHLRGDNEAPPVEEEPPPPAVVEDPKAKAKAKGK